MNQLPVISRQNSLTISLGNWPSSCESFHKMDEIVLHPSPLTRRIVQHVQVQIEDIVPIGFDQFVQKKGLNSMDKSQVQELYAVDIQRRNKQVQILKSIWDGIKIKRAKSSKNFGDKSSSSQQKRILGKQSARSMSKSFQKNKSKSASKSPNYIKGIKIQKSLKQKTKKSESNVLKPKPQQKLKQKSKSIYYDYYNGAKALKSKKKQTDQSSSTRACKERNFSRSNSKKSLSSSSNFSNKKNKSPGPNDKKILLQSLNSLLKKWKELQKTHENERKEMESMNVLLEHQKKRLLKIHKIQTQKINKEIEKIRIKLNSQK